MVNGATKINAKLLKCKDVCRRVRYALVGRYQSILNNYHF